MAYNNNISDRCPHCGKYSYTGGNCMHCGKQRGTSKHRKNPPEQLLTEIMHKNRRIGDGYALLYGFESFEDMTVAFKNRISMIKTTTPEECFDD